jgi:WD40 repeat protein
LVSGGGDGRIKIWDVKACVAAHTCGPQADLMGHYGLMIWTLAFSPDGSLLASGSQSNDRQTLRLWDAKLGKLVAFLTGHRDFVLAARFSPNGRVLASGGNGGDVRLWRVSDFWPLPQRKNIYSSHALLNYLAKPTYDLASAHALVCDIGAATGLEIVGTDAMPAVKGGGGC